MGQMNRTSGNRVALVFSAMLLSIVFSVFMVQAAGTALVRVSPAATNATLGQTFPVDINISTAEKVYGWQLDLRYNNSVLQIISVSEGNFLRQDGANTSFSGGVINNTIGTLKNTYCTRMVTPNGINGTGTLATVTFNATGIGTSRIDLAKVGHGLKIVDELLQTVTAIETNGTAVVNAVLIAEAGGPYSGSEGSPVTFTGSAAGGNPPYQYRWNVSGSWTSWSASSSVSYTWNDDYNGTVLFQAKDNNGGVSQDTSTVTVNNVAPTLAAIGNKQANETVKLEFTISATDPGADTLTYSATNLPSGAQFYPANRTFYWVPSYAQAGSYTNVRFAVSDGDGGQASENITITVANVNRAPAINTWLPVNLTLKTRTKGVIQFNHTSSDPDGEILNYTWKDNSTIKATTQAWRFNATTCGTHMISLSVIDPYSATDTKAWTVNVQLKGDVNNDKIVNIVDMASVGLAFDSSPGDTNWNANANIAPLYNDTAPEGNGVIDISDMIVVGQSFLSSC